MVIGDALDAVRLGRPELMLCGGTDAAIARTRIASFAAMRALSSRTDDPAAASRPFDADREGFVMGEAGAILALEELEHAPRSPHAGPAAQSRHPSPSERACGTRRTSSPSVSPSRGELIASGRSLDQPPD